MTSLCSFTIVNGHTFVVSIHTNYMYHSELHYCIAEILAKQNFRKFSKWELQKMFSWNLRCLSKCRDSMAFATFSMKFCLTFFLRKFCSKTISRYTCIVDRAKLTVLSQLNTVSNHSASFLSSSNWALGATWEKKNQFCKSNKLQLQPVALKDNH